MPDELLALTIITSVLLFVFGIIQSWQRFELKKLDRQSSTGSGESLTTSELHQMIEEAVSGAIAEANEPLKDDLKSLTVRLDQMEGVGDRLPLDDDAGQEKTVGRPVRQRQR
jgi:hypothetical protein